MMRCPLCQAASVSGWTYRSHLRNASRFRCPSCRRWLSVAADPVQPVFAKYLGSAMFLVFGPALLVGALMLIAVALGWALYRVSDDHIWFVLIGMLVVALVAGEVQVRRRMRRTTLVEAEFQQGSPALDGFWKLRSDPDVRRAFMRTLAFFALTVVYLAIVSRLLRWLSHGA